MTGRSRFASRNAPSFARVELKSRVELAGLHIRHAAGGCEGPDKMWTASGSQQHGLSCESPGQTAPLASAASQDESKARHISAELRPRIGRLQAPRSPWRLDKVPNHD